MTNEELILIEVLKICSKETRIEYLLHRFQMSGFLSKEAHDEIKRLIVENE